MQLDLKIRFNSMPEASRAKIVTLMFQSITENRALDKNDFCNLSIDELKLMYDIMTREDTIVNQRKAR